MTEVQLTTDGAENCWRHLGQRERMSTFPNTP